MLTPVRLRIGAAVAGLALVLGTAAGAATVNVAVDAYKRGQLATAQVDRTAFRAALSGGNLHVEGFEGYRPWGTGGGTQNLRHTKVGSFTPFSMPGGGDSVVGDPSKLQVRSDSRMRWARYNTNGSGGLKSGNWLDSNDNRGVKWRIKDVGSFDSVGFMVSDAADIGGGFRIKIGGETVFRTADGGLRNGNLHFVRIRLSETVDRLTIRMIQNRRGKQDGFGLDNMIVGTAAPIPLPAGWLLMLPAVGLLAAAGLRRGRRAA